MQALIMRRVHILGSRASCMIAALLLALSPLAHGLHLAAQNHAHVLCGTPRSRHALCTHLNGHGHERGSASVGRERAEISNSRVFGGQAHDSSTCPVCRTFAQLVKTHWNPSPQAVLPLQETQRKEAVQYQAFPSQPYFFNGYPRAPPAC